MLSSLILLLLVSFETLTLFIIYSSYKITVSEEYLLSDTGKTRVFLKGLLWYIMLNASLQIIRASLLLLLSSNVITGVETVSNLLSAVNLLTLFTIAPLIVYVVTWSLMLYIAVKEVNREEEGRVFLTATASLMLASIILYIVYSIAGTVIMIAALLIQAYLFLKISKKADSMNRRKIKQAGKSIKPSRVRKS